MMKFKRYLFVCAALLAFAGSSALAQAPAAKAAAGNSITIPIQHYLVNLSYDATTGQAKMLGTTLVNGAANVGLEPTGGWRYDVVTGQGEVIDHRFISVPLDCHSANAADPKAKVTCTEKQQFGLSLEIPYDSTAKNINIYDPSQKLAAFVDVSGFANTCGDGVCDANENFNTCPRDCRSGVKDGFCDKVADGVCDPDCAAGQDADCAKASLIDQVKAKTGMPIFPIVIILIIIIVIAVIVAVTMIKKRKGQAPVEGDNGQKQINNPSDNK